MATFPAPVLHVASLAIVGLIAIAAVGPEAEATFAVRTLAAVALGPVLMVQLRDLAPLIFGRGDVPPSLDDAEPRPPA